MDKKLQSDGVLTEVKKKGTEEIGKFLHLFTRVDKSQRDAAGVSTILKAKYKKCIKDSNPVNETYKGIDAYKRVWSSYNGMLCTYWEYKQKFRSYLLVLLTAE